MFQEKMGADYEK